MYETLTKICPGVDEYKIYYAQSLYKAGMYPEAMRAAVRVENPQYGQRMLMLQVSQSVSHSVSQSVSQWTASQPAGGNTRTHARIHARAHSRAYRALASVRRA
jgi:hypothetical protein